MIHIGNFEGIGGFSLAAQWMGWKTLATCEKNKFCRTILEYYWPNAYHHEDIHDFTYELINEKLKEIHGEQWRSERLILTGGFPCQPYSQAGKRLGKDDDRHLWPPMLRTIREIRPTWVVGENVYGIVNWSKGLVFEEVQADLEEIGYSVQPVIIPAASVGAPHKRDRVWFIAHSKYRGQSHTETGLDKSRKLLQGQKRKKNTIKFKRVKQSQFVTNTRSIQLKKRSSNGIGKNQEKKGIRLDDRFKRYGNLKYAANSISTGQQRSRWSKRQCNTEASGNWKKYRVVDDGRWPTQPPICQRNDGLSDRLDRETILKTFERKVTLRFNHATYWRKESLQAFGNAIVPQVAYEIFKAIQSVDDQL